MTYVFLSHGLLRNILTWFMIYIYILYNYMCILYDIYKDRMFNQYNTVIDHIAVEESAIHGEVS